MPTSLNGSLGQPNNFTSVNELITKWPTAAQNQGIKLSGIAFDGVETDYLNPTAIANLTLPTNENPKSWLSYGSSPGIGVASSYDGWFTDPNKIRAEINYNPNTNQSQALKVKWADNQDITSATIDLSALSPKTSLGVGDQGNEVGLLQIFNNGAAVSSSNFTITRLNAPVAAKPITASSNGVTFIGDRTDGSFKFKVEAKPLSGATFDELRFSGKPYDSPTAAYTATPFKDDSSDYLVRNIEYQGTEDPVSLQFSDPTFSVNEDGTPVAAVTVTRTGSSAGTASATVNLTNGTATAPGDYSNTPIPVNFASGDTAPKTIVIPIVNDTLVEPTETVNLSLTNPTGSSRVTLGTQKTATLNILDNDSSLQFSDPTFSVNEDGTPVAAVTVTRTGASTGAVSATVSLADGTATAPADYTNTPIPVSFASGDTTPKVITVPIVNDTLVESPETVKLTLGSPTGNAAIGTQSTATLTILDNDTSLQFSAPTFSVNEDGTPVAAVTVTRAGVSTGAVSATVNLTDGTATGGLDYTNTPIPVSFASGDTTPKTIVVPIINDTLVEPTETVNLTLASPTGGATIGTPSTATLSILDNDSSLQFSSPTFSVNEDGTPVAAVTVTRTGASTGPVSAIVNLADGTATAPADYTNTPIPVSFASGDTTPKVITVPIFNDTLVEPSETINLSLGSATGNASIGTQSTATLTIIDNDSSLQFSAAAFSVNENGTPVTAVTVTRTGASTGPVSAIVNLANGTATGGLDFVNTPIPVSFASGDTTPKTIFVPIFNDTLVEPNETVNLSLGSATGNASIGTPSTATLTIVDNDIAAPVAGPASFTSPTGTTALKMQSSLSLSDAAPSPANDILTNGGKSQQASSPSNGVAQSTLNLVSDFITNSVNQMMTASPTGAYNSMINDNKSGGNSGIGLFSNSIVTDNLWDSSKVLPGTGTDPNSIAGGGSIALNRFATSVL